MPRFYFHIHDGRDLLDTDGIDLPNETTVRVEAIRLVGEVLRDDAICVARGGTWSLEVVDGSGRLIYRIDLRITGQLAHMVDPIGGESALLQSSTVEPLAGVTTALGTT